MNSPTFEWLPEYDGILEHLATTDAVDTEWDKLKDILKAKLDKNITLYLSQSNDSLPAPPTIASPRTLPSGGLKLPPFPPRTRGLASYIPPPPKVLSEDEAKAFKEVIYTQLDSFEGVPFTIQRVCELLLNPQKHYKYLGKYLRAVEKSLLVTSTWDAFPQTTDSAKVVGAMSVSFDSMLLSSAPPTPMFSPIPFLHDDARRSRSQSPPPSPLVLSAVEKGAIGIAAPHSGAETAEPRALGLVDELDDPSPGHLSDHPQPLSATTTVESKPSLAERFVRSSEEPKASNQEVTEEKEDTAMEDPEKENKMG